MYMYVFMLCAGALPVTKDYGAASPEFVCFERMLGRLYYLIG